MKYILGLTGQTGSGKSSLRSVAEAEGFFVIDCDEVAHSVTGTSAQAKEALVQAFSNDILNSLDEIDRKKLAAAAFANSESTELLNRTVLPFIVKEIENIIGKAPKEHILLDAPTLFESGADKICHSTVAVLADENIRRARIIERDNLTPEAAELRLSAAKSDEYYKGKADKIIYNNGDFEKFTNEFKNMLRRNNNE